MRPTDDAIAAAAVFKTAPFFRVPFFYLRHGQSTYNRDGLIAGSVDPALTDLGHAQAEEAAAVLLDHGIGTIHASAAQRARHTAAPLADRLGLPVQTHSDLWERNWGVLEGAPMSRLPERHRTAEQGESLADFNLRVMRTLADLPGPGPILVVAHSGTLRVLRMVLGAGDIPRSIDNALPIRIDPPAGGDGFWRFVALA